MFFNKIQLTIQLASLQRTISVETPCHLRQIITQFDADYKAVSCDFIGFLQFFMASHHTYNEKRESP